MSRTVLTVLGVVLGILLIFTAIGMIISALKFLIWLGFLAVVAAVVVTLIGKLSKGR